MTGKEKSRPRKGAKFDRRGTGVRAPEVCGKNERALRLRKDPVRKPTAVADKHFATLQRARQELKEAHEYAQAIIDAVPPLLVLDADLRVQMANDSFYQHFRVCPPQIDKCLVYELGNGQWNIPRLRTFLEEVLPRHSFFKDFEVTHDFETIGRRTVLLSGRQVDHLEKILLVLDDITERVESNVALRTSEVRYRRLFEAARDGILLLDPDTRTITDANPFMTELLGYTHEELVGKELWQIGLLKDEEASRAAFGELREKHFIRYEDLPLLSKTGQHREVEFVSNVYDQGGTYVIQCNIRDITARREAEQGLVRARNEIGRHAAGLEEVVAERTAQLRETIGELERFSYSVSHDMRAPLRAMQSFASYLLDEYASKLEEPGVTYLHQIMRSSVRLDRLIQDVLSYTRILHGELPIQTVDLDGLVRDIVDIFAVGEPVQPQIQIKGSLPRVAGNEALLAQCISNFLSNGTKFIPPQTTPRIEISAEAMGDELVRICFKDNGVGIAPENHQRIFALFERVHPASEYEGTGIGLTIVRKAIQRMGGQVGFESQLGQGSNFWIELRKA